MDTERNGKRERITLIYIYIMLTWKPISTIKKIYQHNEGSNLETGTED